MSLKKKPVSLADKIGDLLTAVPKSFGSDDEFEETKAKVIEYDDEIDHLEGFKNEFNSLSIRKRNVDLLEDFDKRYVGKKVSKKEIFNQDESFEESNDEDTHSSIEENTKETTKSFIKADNISLDGLENESDEQQSNDESLQENDEESLQEDDEESLQEDDEESLQEDDEGSLQEDSEGSLQEDEEKSLQKDGKKSLQEDNEESDFEDYFNDSIDSSNPLLRDRSSKNSFRTMSTINIREELEKGNCVREQLRLWENFLEMRIKLQKCLITSNKMPQYDVYQNYQSDSEFKVQCSAVKHKLSDLLNNLLQLQSNLVNNYPETKDVLIKSKKRKIIEEESEINIDPMNEEISSDTENEIHDTTESNEQEDLKASNDKEKKGPVRKKIKMSEFESIISKNHKSYTEYRNSVIQKWNDRVRIASGIMNKRGDQPVLKQIEFILANRDKLLKRTHLQRSEYDILGKSLNSLEDNNGFRIQEYDSEIYDDDDFYHQLLRELIEYKSSDTTDPVQLSKQWIQLQNMRNKMKRKIDTRATKGRRIRYNIHKKLVSFMAPIPTFDTWTDHAKDELFSSLFGAIKSIRKEITSTQ